MKRAINSIIALLSLLCLIGAVKLSSLPLWPSFSENSFWYTSPTVRESFSLLYDMFVGFLLSAVFYFGVEVLPEILKLHRGKKLICNYINILLENMEQIISITTQVFQIDTTKIYLKDLVRLSGNTTHSHEEVSYSTTTYYNSGKRKTGVKSGGEFDSIIKSCIATIEAQLQNIRRYSSFFASDERFLEIITRIEACEFISNYRKERSNPAPCFLYANSGECFWDFYRLYSELRKFSIHTEFSKTVIDTPEQAALYKKRRDSGEMLYNAAEYQQKRTEAYANEKPVILSQDIIKGQNIIAIIQKSVPESCVYNQDEVDPSCLKSSQLLIILGKNIDLKLVGAEVPPKTFCFVGRIVSTKPAKRSNRTDNVEEVFYQKSISLLGISIFAEHPTLTDIHNLTSAVDEYIRDKYELELLL